MFLFRWMFHLVFLPFRLLAIPLALVGAPLKMVLKFIVKRPITCLLIVLGIYVIAHLSDNKQNIKYNVSRSMPQLQPTQAAPRTQNGQPAPVIEPVRKRENGDSRFATDVYAMMTDQERVDYSKNYYYAMNTMPNGQVHSWNAYNIAGAIRPSDSFTNGYGERCRHFNETLKVHTIQQTLSGTACVQGNGGWCKLPPNATPVCGLSKNSGGMLEGIARSLGF